MKKILFVIMAALSLICCNEPAISPPDQQVVGYPITAVGRLYMLSKPCTTSPCVPGATLALYTSDTTYYVTNEYTAIYEDFGYHITTCGKQFLGGEYVRVTGELTNHIDIYDTKFYRINIESIESHSYTIEGEAVPIHYTSYVYSYSFPNAMQLSNGEFLYGMQPYDGSINSPYGFYVTFYSFSAPIGQWLYESSGKEIFDSLSIKHHDTCYHQDILVGYNRYPHEYIGIDFTSITVTSDADFDEQHPAGTPLNDMVQFMAYTPYPYILSGYKYSLSISDGRDKLKDEIILIDKPLSECTSEDFILTLGYMENYGFRDSVNSCYLLVKGTPTLAKQHTITVTIVDDTGKTWQASIKLDWNN